MKNILIFLLYTFFIFGCSKEAPVNDKLNKSENIIRLKKVDKISVDDIGYDFFETDHKTYVTSLPIQRQILEMAYNWKEIRRIGNKGKGPGEFLYISSFSQSNNRYFITDYINHRLSIFNNMLQFENSFIMKHNYINTVLSYKNKLLLLGKCPADLYHQQNDYYIGDLYINESSYYKFKKSVMKIREFPIFTSDNIVGIDQIVAISRKNIAIILYCYSPYAIIFDFNTESIVRKVKIDFPEYINPIEINFKKYNKLGKEKWKLQYYPQHLFSFSPYFFWYDSINKKYLVQYLRPYQKIVRSENKKRFIVVLFDDNFNYIGNFYTNNRIILAKNIGESVEIYTVYLPFRYKKEENIENNDDKIYNEIFKFNY